MNLNSKIIRIVLAVIVVLAGMMAYYASNGKTINGLQNAAGTAAKPAQEATSTVSAGISNLFENVFGESATQRENDELRREINKLRKKQVSYDRILQENEEYKKMLNIKDRVADYDIINAMVIGRDGVENAYSFTIDKGTGDGIEVDDVVISSDGVVGVVVETGAGFSKVSTILNSSVSAGCYVGENMDVGIAGGSYDLSKSDMCAVQYLPKTSRAKEGDLVSTSGYGTVFPSGLIIGKVKEVTVDVSGNYLTAWTEPAADIENVKIVFVLKNKV